MTPRRAEAGTDQEIWTAVRDELARAPSVSGEQVGVGVTDGAVTLAGQVQTLPEKDAALRAALRVRGVTAVVDEIVVQHSWGPRADADIAREATQALAVAAPASPVRAIVHDQVVTLAGTVDRESQRAVAAAAVAVVPGVLTIRDAVVVRPCVGPPVVVSPAAARERIAATLVRSAIVDAESVQVDVDGPVVTLTGTVSSPAERHLAEDAAWSTSGVQRVHNHLRVDRESSISTSVPG